MLKTMKLAEIHLGFLGFGHMAQTLFRAIAGARLLSRSQISFIQRDPQKMRANEQKYGITSTSLESLVHQSHLIILAVRPNQIRPVLEELKEMAVHPSKGLISLLAGVQTDFFRKALQRPVLRAMPNIASDVGMGMTVLSAPDDFPKELLSLTRSLFASVGAVEELPEALMDITCGVSGSGPGFVFKLIEAFAKAGEKEGIEAATAQLMAAQTFLGAAQLVLKRKDIASLLEQISVPQGTTEAGLKKLHELQLDEHLQQVIFASSKRSEELSKEYQ